MKKPSCFADHGPAGKTVTGLPLRLAVEAPILKIRAIEEIFR
jgi:hypothetical protein